MTNENWPSLEYRHTDGAIVTIGKIPPFPFPVHDGKFLAYELCGLPVTLRGPYNQVSGVLAASVEDALNLLAALGPR